MGRVFAAFIIILSILISPLQADTGDFEPVLMEGARGRSWSMGNLYVDGNPVLELRTDITGSNTIRERFPGSPAWIVSGDFDANGRDEAGILFSDGTVRFLALDGERLRTISTASRMAPQSPPVPVAELGGEPTGGLVAVDGRGDLVTLEPATGRTTRLAGGFSVFSYPVAADLDADGDLEIAAVGDGGRMTLVKAKIQSRTESSTTMLPDTRISVADLDGDGKPEIIAFSRPTDDPAPQRLGDSLEAQGMAVFSWNGSNLSMEDEIVLPEGQIFEALTPVVVKGDDGGSLVVTVVTRKEAGSALKSFSYNRGRLRERRSGPETDAGVWVHVTGGAKLGDSDQTWVITSAVTGEDSGELGLYRTDLARTKLTLSSTVSTHTSGSRHVETTLVADFNADGSNEILIPGRDKGSLQMVTLEKNRLRATDVYTGIRRIATNLCP
ncbi:MAG: hypothetical protein JSV00_06030 [bacterium]|nr:MAG: hypothetical protein JSV00_06030 [bacterium]